MKKLKWVGVYCLGVATGCLLASAMLSFAQDKPKRDFTELRRFTDAFALIKEAYVDDVTDKTLVDYCLTGMLESLDSKSAYYDPPAFDDLKNPPGPPAGAIGAMIHNKRRSVLHLIPLDGSPAQRAGMKVGDVLVELDGVNVQKKSATDVARMFRGESGDVLNFKVMREGSLAPISLAVKREIMNPPAVKMQALEKGIAYVRVPNFNETTAPDLVERLREFSGPLRGVILDLRDNPGGTVSGAIAVASVFLKPDVNIVELASRDTKDSRVYKATPADYRAGRWNGESMQSLPPSVKTVPMGVLVNGESSSGAEIVAAALQDYQRAVIIGSKTPGDTTVQTIYPIGNAHADAIKLTTARWLSANGRPLAGRGVLPDIAVDNKDPMIGDVSGKDPQFYAALREVQRK